MLIVRLLILSCLFSMAFITYGSADIESWVDQNGVRHFSNVDASQKSGEVKSTEEVKSFEADKKPEPTERKWNSYEEICRENHYCNEENDEDVLRFVAISTLIEGKRVEQRRQWYFLFIFNPLALAEGIQIALPLDLIHKRYTLFQNLIMAICLATRG